MQTRFRRRLSASLSCALVVAALGAGMARADNVAVGQVSLVGRAPKPRADRVFLLRRDPTLLDRPLGKLRQRFLNPSKPLVEKLLLHFKHSDVESSRSANLRNARPHQPATENSNLLDFHDSVKPRARFFSLVAHPFRSYGTDTPVCVRWCNGRWGTGMCGPSLPSEGQKSSPRAISRLPLWFARHCCPAA